LETNIIPDRFSSVSLDEKKLYNTDGRFIPAMVAVGVARTRIRSRTSEPRLRRLSPAETGATDDATKTLFFRCYVSVGSDPTFLIFRFFRLVERFINNLKLSD